ncbi:MAG: GNAT family N-acetyltransferase [Crocinitomicaceae bacterium]|nr:GNAT family N-acetyltransferase [Flavobacteriales bacterium]NQZ34428.1 GNAT family N-acetyltransferase [Crocinitomicaceae bacterium]
MNFTPFPELTTERLLLRKIEASDYKEILLLRTDETVTKFIERPVNKQIKDEPGARKLIKELNGYIERNESITWGIVLKNNPQVIGTICLWNFSQNHKTAEVGYELNPKFHGKGIMSEAIKTIVDFGFNQLKLDKIEAFTHNKNENSNKLLEKNGFNLNENRTDLDNTSNNIFEITIT